MRVVTTSLLAILLVFAVVLAGCSKGEVKESSNQAGQANDNKAEQNETSDSGQISTETYYTDSPIKITQNWVQSVVPYPEGQDPKDNSYTRWAKDKLGIILEPEWVAPDSETDDQKLNLGLVSGALPDLIKTSPANIYKLAEAERIMPIDELFEKYASPLGKFLFEEYNNATGGTALLPFTYEGKVYGLPLVTDVWAVGQTTDWIRKDVLDDLGLAVPVTLADYEGAMDVYVKKFPNGVGHHMERLAGMETAMFAHGAFPNHWVDDGNGNLVFGSIQPEVKKGLETLHNWFENGWIDKEFMTVQNLDAFIRGEGLSLRSHWSNVWWAFPALSEIVADAEVVPVTVFQGPDNKHKVMTPNPVGEGFAINADTEHPEAIIHLFNEYAESFFRNHEDLQEKFQLKYAFVKQDDPDKITNPEEVQAAKDANKDWRLYAEYSYDEPGPGFFNDKSGDFHTYMGIKLNERAYSIYDWTMTFIEPYFTDTMDTLTQDELDSYDILPSGMSRIAHLMNVRNWNELAEEKRTISEMYLGPPTKAMIEKNAYLKKLEEETFAKIIMGTIPLDEFDTFVEGWKKEGGDTITQEVNAWYQSVTQ